MSNTPRTDEVHHVAMSLVVGDDYSTAHDEMLQHARQLERELNAALDINDVNADVTYKLQVQLVRQAIFQILDENGPRDTPGLAWDFNDDEERVDFADRVVALLAPQRYAKPDNKGNLQAQGPSNPDSKDGQSGVSDAACLRIIAASVAEVGMPDSADQLRAIAESLEGKAMEAHDRAAYRFMTGKS